MKHRVVITGLGVITPLGIGLKKNWERLLNGESGVSRITHFDPSTFPSQIAGTVNGFDPSDYLEAKTIKRMDVFIQYAVVAALMAFQDAALDLSELNPYRTGSYVGNIWGGLPVLERNIEILNEHGNKKISPVLIASGIPSMASAQVSMHLKAKGPICSSSDACAASTISIGDAFRAIQRGEADVIYTGGTESLITPVILGGLSNANALSRRKDQPTKASRPFDRDRDGFVMAEGAGMLILEELRHAEARGARIYAEIVGRGCSMDAFHIMAPCPEGEGAAWSMKSALDDAGIAPSDVNYINAHGTSTKANDRMETMAIKKVFGEHAYSIPISSNKSMIGHLLGASGAVEAIFTVLSIYHAMIPPTINHENPDPECDLDYVPNKARERKTDYALSNSFGFGGVNGTLLFKSFNSR
ncbi:MAG: beta-ketoacyl-ACP synthase II [Thermodesulfobacteriota bacterium]|nr:beta-ketoacyl-ACP synthase II [Thermodesulfobacteriota bacterium]